MHKHHILIAAVVIAASISLGLGQETADTVLYNGKVLTVDSNFTIAQAVAVSGNRVTAVGTDDEVLGLAGPNTLRIDLKGKTVTPGLIHTHVHLQSVGGYGSVLGVAKSRQIPLRVRGMNTPDEVLQAIRDVIAAFKFPPGEWLYFSPNWTGSQADLIFNQLNAKELDKAAPDHPIVMRVGISSNNIQMMNSMALSEMWRKYGPFLEKYGRYWADAFGKPTGILEAPASQIVWEDPEFGIFPKPEDAGPYFRKILVENYSALGITTISGALNTANVQAYQWLDARDEMPLRYGYGAMAGFQPGRDMQQYQLGDGTDTIFITSVTARATDGGGVRRCITLTRDNQEISAATAESALNSGDMNAVATEWWPRGQCNLDIEYKGSTRGARISGNRFLEWYREVALTGLRSANSHAAGEASIY
ncbi:MAG: amidohydrolase family protein, partial [Acidobacteria bacterium]|nr:amidohydrolase family protein [Acidobacteriota bacterium]